MNSQHSAQAKAWSRIVVEIKKAASAEGIDIKQFGKNLQVSGYARQWDDWIDGKRIARKETRCRIIEEAKRRGWLKSIRLSDIAALPDVIIQSMDDQIQESFEWLPTCPPGMVHLTPPVIVQALLTDAARGVPRKRSLDFSEKDRDIEYLKWKSAVLRIKALLASNEESDQEVKLSGHVADLLRAQLIAVYIGRNE